MVEGSAVTPRQPLAALMELSLNLAAAIRRRRTELGLSQTQLAERTGPEIQQSDISRLERGLVSLPRPEFLKRLAAALDTTALELLNSAKWLTDEDLARYSSEHVQPSGRPLAIVAGRDLAATTAIVDVLTAGAFRYLLTFDARTLVDTVASQSPEVVIVTPMAPAVPLAELADALRSHRLDATVIAIGAEGGTTPAQFHRLDMPVSTDALWRILRAAGYGDH